MKARAADVRDISNRLIGALSDKKEKEAIFDGREVGIICADDLAPSETMQLDREKVAAFITSEGSVNSHTAILARTMGIPAVVDVGEELMEAKDGVEAIVDGFTGKVYLEPNAATLEQMKQKMEEDRKAKDLLQKYKGMDNVTLDGTRIEIFANIQGIREVGAALLNDAGGIGLFRSEFLYLDRTDFPDEEEQFRVYKTVLQSMGGKKVVIRTLDIGADKQVGYFGMKKEENPALGVRGVRLCLNRPEVFHTQLRALYRASAHGKVAIMFPMIASVWEVRECREACRKVMAELDGEGVPYDRETEIGIMLETPASILVADALAREVDFFSVGTNDLTQYTLACDRQSNELGRFFDPHHPAVLRALSMAAEAAHAAGIWIGICGELAADTDLLPAFLAMGIDELSVSPAAVLPLRAAIRESVAGECSLEKLNY